MMSSKNSGFTASDIERYHSGQMPVQERHALEKAALDDPFLADALEGYTFTPTPVADIAAIRERLDERLNRKKVVLFFKKYRWLSAAAVFVILAGAGWFSYKALTPAKNSYAVAPNSEERQENTSKSANTLPDSTVHEVTGSTTKAGNNGETQDREKTSTGNVQLATAPNSLSNASKNRQQDVSEEKKEDVNENANAGVRSNDNAVASRRKLTRNIQQENNSEGYVSNMRRQDDVNMNRVMSPDPRANNISNRASNISNTDREQVYNKDSNNETAAIAGKVRGVVAANDTINVNVVLQRQNMDTAEVVVVGYGTEKQSRDKYPRVTIDTLEPADGYGNFDTYIASNLKMPEEVKAKTISGEVQLAFDVDRKGRPVNIAVVKSLCQKCDEEAIRLLKEGPKWKKNRNKKGKITIKF